MFQHDCSSKKSATGSNYGCSIEIQSTSDRQICMVCKPKSAVNGLCSLYTASFSIHFANGYFLFQLISSKLNINLKLNFMVNENSFKIFLEKDLVKQIYNLSYLNWYFPFSDIAHFILPTTVELMYWGLEPAETSQASD
ncbi:hypothetical protein EGR_04700 [Echinococcus granulosus]|uniref:Uncharacterized protein n=1 Tax=Echinococcus granulosus TaxID=6210 RepID=W6UHG2_ECHGR|nr:hypothetical protein EGR_04700 [Echinococcus granulosus]EUB60506.1 hypothetical protein EGR_04700 [Echinococcus granulosus]